MTRTPRMIAVLAGTMLALSACGSSDGTSDAAEPSAETPTTTTAAPTRATPSATTATPTPKATASTTPRPMGDLLDYETADEDGAMITVAADTGKLTGAPGDFKSFIAGELTKKSSVDEGCTEPPQIYVSRIDTGGWARGGHFIPQCGGYATLWAKSGGSWKDVWSGQSLVDCETLERFAFPVRVAGDSCLDGEEAVTYAG